MSYRCGIAPGIPGLKPDTPHVFCDVCKVRLEVTTRGGLPPSWLLNNKAPPGWRMVRNVDGTRLDFCPSHK